MRIVAGERRGTKLYSPGSDISRPITDRVKESVFSVLFKYGLPGGVVVGDLFCGVGSMGLEALSRGAGFAVFVEKDAEVAAVLKRNIEKCDYAGKCSVVRGDAFKVGVPVYEDRYGLVFVDPPYRLTKDAGRNSLLAKLFEVLTAQTADNGIVTVRTERKTKLLERYGDFKMIERRQWGTMTVGIFQQVRDVK